MVGKRLDLTSYPQTPPPADSAGETARFLGVHFACCSVYARVYPNADGTAYIGHCPQCANRVQFKIGRDGTADRFFTAY